MTQPNFSDENLGGQASLGNNGYSRFARLASNSPARLKFCEQQNLVRVDWHHSFMDPQTLLQDFGLTQKQAQVYLGLLQLGQSSVLSISHKVGLKRPTVYLILDDLVRMGYAAIVPRDRKKLFVALPPERLRENFQKRQEALEQLLPQLSALYNTKTTKPAVQLFEGKQGILKVYQEIVLSGEKELLSFFSPERISSKADESFKLFIKLLKEKPYIKSRELIYTKDNSHFYLQAIKKLPNHEARFVPEQYKFFTDNIIWLDKIAIFSFEKEFAVVIQSKDVADTFRSLFELAWVGARSLEMK